MGWLCSCRDSLNNGKEGGIATDNNEAKKKKKNNYITDDVCLYSAA